jgi:amphi-Trp domain-containing protein
VSNKDFEFTAMQAAKDVAEYLRSIAQGLENRKLSITCGQDVFELNVPNHVEFRLVGKVRDDEQRLRLQFTWSERPPAGAPELNIA